MDERAPDFLSIELVWRDDELLEIECCVATRGWMASTRAYTSVPSMADNSRGLQRFAGSLAGEFVLVAGTSDDMGRVELTFRTDHHGHVHVGTHLARERHGAIWKLAAELEAELEALSRFARHYATMASSIAGRAVLRGVH